VPLKKSSSNDEEITTLPLIEPQPFFRLIRLPGFSEKINQGTVSITEIIEVFTFLINNKQKHVSYNYKQE
jgi:hypothetical protein